jgi:uridine phosphorylase
MQLEDLPLFEFDSDTRALIEPKNLFKEDILPEYCVMPFYGSLVRKLKDAGQLEKVFELSTAGVSLVPTEVFKTTFEGKAVTVAFPGIGAPAAGAMMEELIALGCRKIMACGSCGVLKSELKPGALIIPSSALRDEGTSYHYWPPSRDIAMEESVVHVLEAVLQKHHIGYETGKTWTMDAFYRETRQKIARRKADGCITVEMECAALMAIARFRNVTFGQYLSAGDDISGDEWDLRFVADRMTFQEKIFRLSLEACLSL